jgi:ABC-type multidrug transport system permease subunit
MAYTLIPLPISILFTLVFVVVVMFLLWKIRRRAKIFKILFYLCVVVALFLLAGIIYSLVTEPKLLLSIQHVEAVFL